MTGRSTDRAFFGQSVTRRELLAKLSAAAVSVPILGALSTAGRADEDGIDELPQFRGRLALVKVNRFSMPMRVLTARLRDVQLRFLCEPIEGTGSAWLAPERIVRWIDRSASPETYAADIEPPALFNWQELADALARWGQDDFVHCEKHSSGTWKWNDRVLLIFGAGPPLAVERAIAAYRRCFPDALAVGRSPNRHGWVMLAPGQVCAREGESLGIRSCRSPPSPL